MKKIKFKNKGSILIQVIILGAIATYLLGALVGWAVTNLKASKQTFDRELALQIAEAGVDYYRWHLAQSPTDYQDGTEQTGPYIHDFLDKNKNILGQFILDITPPPLGSSLVLIKSTGQVKTNPNISRTIISRLAKPSIAKYAVVANSAMRFGEETEIFGPIHSNGGIRFDGLTHNIISSGIALYDDPDHSDHDLEFGVHTHISPADPLPPNEIPPRLDIFETGRQFPTPNVDFSAITTDLTKMKSDAETAGFYYPDSGSLGYHITLKINDTFDLYKITELADNENCGNETWSIQKEEILSNEPFPTNGIIFLEDDVWVDGQINGARLTIIAAVLPDNSTTRKSITVNDNLLYTNYDGSDVIGLIAQKNINVGLISDDDLRIDAALIAQNGRVGRFYYESDCSSYSVRDTITLWGMIATNLRYGFSYTDGTGYENKKINYDSNLLYSPPPSFPLTSDKYVTLSWEEVK
jgi:hypothetical protein